MIVSHEVRDLLRRCLLALEVARARYPATVEVVVVDNASRDGSAELVAEEFPHVSLSTFPENRGFSCAVNHGARRAQGELLLLLNPDTEVPPEGLVELAAALARHEATALGVRQVDAAGRLQLAVGPGPTLWGELGRKVVQARLDRGDPWMGRLVDAALARPRRVPWVAGSCLLVRREAFASIGGFDEGFFLYFEDIDFCLRLGAAGGRVVYDPGVTILHHRGRSAGRDRRASERAYRTSQVRFWRKHRGRAIAALVGLYLRLRRRGPA